MKLKIVGKEKIKSREGKVFTSVHCTTDVKCSSVAGSNYGGIRVVSYLFDYKPEHDKLLIGGEYSPVVNEYMQGNKIVQAVIGLQ